MKEILKDFFSAILAGICIGIGGIAYLSCADKTVGALFFTLGLFTIVTHGFNLFTGKVCYLFDNKPFYILKCIAIWLGNFVGTGAVALSVLLTRYGDTLYEKASALYQTKEQDGFLSLFILGIFCNMMIYIAVEGFKSNSHHVGKYLALFFGVAGFIVCGFEHCIADMFYFALAKEFSITTFAMLGIITAGNVVGGVLIPIGKKVIATKA